MMKKKNYFLLLFIYLFFLLGLSAQTDLALIPYPKEVSLQTGNIEIEPGIKVIAPPNIRKLAEKSLTEKLKWKMSGRGIPVKMSIVDAANPAAESYRLCIAADGIKVESHHEAGLFYGLQTLIQLGIQYGSALPLLEIKDEPRFAWRAYMLDEGRYFQGKAAVLQLLDEMALLKMNIFHWHLTDDAGWRIEIKKYPLLTTVGGRRDSSQINENGKKWQSGKYDGKVHAGFYTQKDVREIVAYAKARNITIVPEINMPGHASAAVASYPWLGTSKEPIRVPTRFGVVSTVFDVSSPRVTQFLQDVLEEVIALFPSAIIHIGGDEVKYDQWEKSRAVNAYLKKHKLPAYSDLQVFFSNNMSNFIADKLNRRMMGWNEILGFKTHDYQETLNATTHLSKNAIIHFWKGSSQDFANALEGGYQIVNSNHSHTYLDYTYQDIDLAKAYHFDPIPEGLDQAKGKNIIGLGCQMWGEWTPTFKEVTFQTFPRIAAYAETGWSAKSSKNYKRFIKNLLPLYQYWQDKGYSLPDKTAINR
ncbi:MAG: Beta-N-acetylhexosaminidase [Sphingobacterium sp.]|jgi:hexosaminidase|nr:Beta-N-acetylhexosaminidase [Sphingobacterium sp.]